MKQMDQWNDGMMNGAMKLMAQWNDGVMNGAMNQIK